MAAAVPNIQFSLSLCDLLFFFLCVDRTFCCIIPEIGFFSARYRRLAVSSRIKTKRIVDYVNMEEDEA
jgi:hypothetical protein